MTAETATVSMINRLSNLTIYSVLYDGFAKGTRKMP